MTAFINGIRTLDTNLDDYRNDFEKTPGLQRAAGRIGFQNQNSTTRFRNIRINSSP